MRHLENAHSNIRSFECPADKRVFENHGRLMKHFQTSHPVSNTKTSPGSFSCPVCRKSNDQMTSVKDMWDHMEKTHINFGDFECTRCNLSFRSKVAFVCHFKKSHPERVVATTDMSSKGVQHSPGLFVDDVNSSPSASPPLTSSNSLPVIEVNKAKRHNKNRIKQDDLPKRFKSGTVADNVSTPLQTTGSLDENVHSENTENCNTSNSFSQALLAAVASKKHAKTAQSIWRDSKETDKSDPKIDTDRALNASKVIAETQLRNDPTEDEGVLKWDSKSKTWKEDSGIRKASPTEAVVSKPFLKLINQDLLKKKSPEKGGSNKKRDSKSDNLQKSTGKPSKTTTSVAKQTAHRVKSPTGFGDTSNQTPANCTNPDQARSDDSGLKIVSYHSIQVGDQDEPTNAPDSSQQSDSQDGDIEKRTELTLDEPSAPVNTKKSVDPTTYSPLVDIFDGMRNEEGMESAAREEGSSDSEDPVLPTLNVTNMDDVAGQERE